MANLRARYYGCESSFLARAEEGALCERGGGGGAIFWGVIFPSPSGFA